MTYAYVARILARKFSTCYTGLVYPIAHFRCTNRQWNCINDPIKLCSGYVVKSVKVFIERYVISIIHEIVCWKSYITLKFRMQFYTKVEDMPVRARKALVKCKSNASFKKMYMKCGHFVQASVP